LKNLYDAGQQFYQHPQAYLKALGVKVLNTHDVKMMPQQYIPPALLNMTIPTDFDARIKWPKCKTIQQIRMQGGCGACWVIQWGSLPGDL
jgi:hypothetical protein